MTKINLHYDGNLLYRAAHAPSGVTLLTDAPVDNHGKGSSFSPTDLVAAALGSCMGTIIAIVAERHGINIKGTEISVEKIMTAKPFRKIDMLRVEVKIPHKISEDNKKRLIHAAETCPVIKSIHPDIKVPITYEWA